MGLGTPTSATPPAQKVGGDVLRGVGGGRGIKTKLFLKAFRTLPQTKTFKTLNEIFRFAKMVV